MDAGVIYRINPDGTGFTVLTTSLGDDYGPAWSPDGTQLAYVCATGATAELCVMNADGTEQKRLTDHPAGAVWPCWCPVSDDSGEPPERKNLP